MHQRGKLNQSMPDAGPNAYHLDSEKEEKAAKKIACYGSEIGGVE